jgi:hypothetical protein
MFYDRGKKEIFAFIAVNLLGVSWCLGALVAKKNLRKSPKSAGNKIWMDG